MRELFLLLTKSRRFMSGLVLFTLIMGFALIGPWFHQVNPFAMTGGLFYRPSDQFLLGTDNLGRDILSQLMHGTRTSMMIGLIAGGAATSIGVVIGSVAGFTGGLVDDILMGFTNILITIPPIVVLILLSVAVSVRSAVVMGIIIGVTSWPWTARAVRAQATSLKEREHVDLARITGFNNVEMIVREILPYMFSYIFMVFILQVTSGILSEATLSMLGLGPFRTVSLGQMLHWSLLWESVRVGAWWAFIPAVICLTTISFSLQTMNTGMDEVFNPKLRKD